MLNSASSGNSKQPDVEVSGSWHTLHVDVPGNDIVEKDDEITLLVNKVVEKLNANADGDFNQRRDDQFGYLVDSVITTLGVVASTAFTKSFCGGVLVSGM